MDLEERNKMSVGLVLVIIVKFLSLLEFVLERELDLFLGKEFFRIIGCGLKKSFWFFRE